MKRPYLHPKLWLSIFLLLLTISSFAQDKSTTLFQNADKKFFGGVTIGLNTSQVDGDGYSGFHRAGLNAGGLVYWFFSKQVGVSLEFLYSQKGSHGVTQNFSPYNGASFGEYKLRLNYIEVPLMFHYRFRQKYIIGFGGSFNAFLNSKETRTNYGQPVYFDHSKYPFNPYSFDIMAGISMVLWHGFLVNARYEYGVTPLRNHENVPLFGPGVGGRDQFDNMMTFRLIYLF